MSNLVAALENITQREAKILDKMDAMLTAIETKYPNRRDGATLALTAAMLLIRDELRAGLLVTTRKDEP